MASPASYRLAVALATVAAVGGGGLSASAAEASKDRLLAPTAKISWSARVVVATVARRAPSHRARAVWHVPTEASWTGGPVVLAVLASSRDRAGRRWIKVDLPVRPNRRSGWIPLDRVSLSRTAWRVRVSTGRRTLVAYRAGRVARRARVVVGKPATPTPLGHFAIYERDPKGPGSVLGPIALHLTAMSNTLFNYGGGPGRVAMHGRAGALLADPLGTASSHGCIRMSNANISWLAHRLPRGTPVFVVH